MNEYIVSLQMSISDKYFPYSPFLSIQEALLREHVYRKAGVVVQEAPQCFKHGQGAWS